MKNKIITHPLALGLITMSSLTSVLSALPTDGISTENTAKNSDWLTPVNNISNIQASFESENSAKKYVALHNPEVLSKSQFSNISVAYEEDKDDNQSEDSSNDDTSTVSTPEPSSTLILGLAGVALILRRRM